MIDPATIQRDFPSLGGRIYLNTAAEGIPPRATGQAVAQYMEDKLLGMDGRVRHQQVEEACREITARHLGLQPQEVAFCSCSAEAYNLLAGALDLQPEHEVVINDLDFPSGATPWLASRRQPRLRLWQSGTDGALPLEALESLLNAETRLVQLSLVSFYNGYRLPWAEVAATVRRLAPQALLAADVTQALGRIPLAGLEADVIISSTHKWALGIHGGGIVGIPARAATRITTTAGGWYHLENAFESDRFERAAVKPGAAGFATGMPSYAPIYALNAGLRYLDAIGVEAIAAYADPLVARLHAGLLALGLSPMAPYLPENPSGIIAFRHPRAAAIHAALHQQGIHVMHHAGRVRIAVHGYNTLAEIEALLAALQPLLAQP